jgi:hypothetical protein
MTPPQTQQSTPPARDMPVLYQAGMAALNDALHAAAIERDVENALSTFCAATRSTLGDQRARERPGALKPDEKQFSVSGIFLLASGGRENILVAEHGFPAEQHRLRIPVNLGHPGWVVENRRALLLANTDDDKDFKQILKTARMGSSMYSPLIWHDQFIGQLITASQARHTYGPHDHTIHQVFANAAAAVFMANDGPAFLRLVSQGATSGDASV